MARGEGTTGFLEKTHNENKKRQNTVYWAAPRGEDVVALIIAEEVTGTGGGGQERVN